MSSYWEQVVPEALSDCGISATESQIDELTGWIEGCAENEGIATGMDVATRNYISNEQRLIEGLHKKIEEMEFGFREIEAELKDSFNRDRRWYANRIRELEAEIND